MSFFFARRVPANKFLKAGVVPANKFLKAGGVPANEFLKAGGVPVNKFLKTGGVPANNLFLNFYHLKSHIVQLCQELRFQALSLSNVKFVKSNIQNMINPPKIFQLFLLYLAMCLFIFHKVIFL
jgi:hypothetical protein